MTETTKASMTLRLTRPLRGRLREYAERHGWSSNTVICLALEEFLSQREARLPARGEEHDQA